ncbi:MAG: hypothetical protein V1844_17705 [Pseudomonadota bacterium]
MNKNDKNHRDGKPPILPEVTQGRSGRGGILWVLAIAAVLGYMWDNSPQMQALLKPVPVAEAAEASPFATVAEVKPDWQKLKGKWLRPDGGYIIEIKKLDDSGKMDAAYFNPKPIRVARAEATRDGATIKVFIELRDVNYPGSTYTLTYEPGSDQLKGIYFQAVQQQSYEVVFIRLKGNET